MARRLQAFYEKVIRGATAKPRGADRVVMPTNLMRLPK
jgi:hypothetical protein